LLCGKTDALGVVHHIDHRGGELAEGRVEPLYRLAFFAENRIVVVNNSQGHWSVRDESVVSPRFARKSLLHIP